jgi:uncharacterized protein DUF4349
MDPHREIDLATELRAMRPTPEPEFVAELDARAAAGFPKKDGGGSPRRRIASWLDRMPKRRLPAFAGAAATVAIAVATAVVAISEDGPASRTALQQDAGTHPDQPAVSRAAAAGGSGVQYSDTPPTVNELRSESFGAQPRGGLSRLRSSAAKAADEAAVMPFSSSVSGPYASRAEHRDVERSARIVLATDATGVRSAAARVFETVHSYDGIVMRSSVRDGGAGAAGAVFDLLIPSGKLGDALAAFSDIAEVRSRSEATLDVTAPKIGLEERLRDARATVEGLLAQLAGADTTAEREAIDAELRAERRRLASLRSRLAALQRRTHFSRVSLRIETGAAAAAGDRWGVDDALDGAGRILTVAAGVTLIGLAILSPLALICLLAWFARRRWVHSRRERALT